MILAMTQDTPTQSDNSNVRMGRSSKFWWFLPGIAPAPIIIVSLPHLDGNGVLPALVVVNGFCSLIAGIGFACRATIDPKKRDTMAVALGLLFFGLNILLTIFFIAWEFAHMAC
jgi:hypothetical protein